MKPISELLKIAKETIGAYNNETRKMECAPLSDRDLIDLMNVCLFDFDKPFDGLSLYQIRDLLRANRMGG